MSRLQPPSALTKRPQTLSPRAQTPALGGVGPFDIRHFCLSSPDRITPFQNLNLGRDSNCTIFAIYFQKTGVGRGSPGKNPLKIIITPWILGIFAVMRRV